MPNILTLYHGTTHEFAEINVNRGKPFKDFGQGFYLTETYEHARNIAIRNRRIEEERLSRTICPNSIILVLTKRRNC